MVLGSAGKAPRTDAAMRKDPNISFCPNFALDNVTKITYRKRIIQNFVRNTGAPVPSARPREGGDPEGDPAGVLDSRLRGNERMRDLP